jgi:protein phosphatase
MIQAVLSQVNQEIFSRGAQDERYRGMGTTLTMIVVCGQRMHVAHVGDSRAYLCNPDGVTDDEHQSMRLTSDHTLVARLVDIGQLTPEAARSHGQRNVLYRALGIRAAVDADILSQPVTVGDVLVLCSDGLVQHVADDELAQFVLTSGGADAICQRLIDTANQRGGRDNIGVVVAQVERISAGQ